MSKASENDSDVVRSVRKALPHPLHSYAPSDAQRELKAKFWLAFKANPLCDEDKVTQALVEQLTGVSIQGYLSDRAFWSWFNVKDQVRQNLEVAAERASELAMAYLDPSIPMNDNARVQLIKYVLEFSGRTPPQRTQIKYADKDIGDMSPDELDAYIKKHAKTALPPTDE